MRSALIAVTCCLLIAAPAAARRLQQASAPATVEYASIPEFAAGADGFSTFFLALNATGLLDTVSDADVAVTVFAPTDLAFELFLASYNWTLSDMMDSDALLPILEYHMVPAVIQLVEMVSGEELPTMFVGQNLTLSSSVDGSLFTVQGDEDAAGITQGDIIAGQSVVHVINEVLLPSQTALEAYVMSEEMDNADDIVIQVVNAS